MPQPLQIQLQDAKQWIDKETASLIEPLKGKASSLLTEVQVRIEDTVQSSKKILENSEGEMNKNNPKTHRFARNANKFAQNLDGTIKALAIPDDISYEELHAFCNGLEKTFASLAQLRAEAYPYISPYFIFDRRRLDVSFKRLYDITKELRSFITTKYARAKTAEDARSLVDRLQLTISEAKQNQENMKQTEEKRQTLENEIVETKQKIGELQGKAELNEVLKLEQKIRELRENVKHSLRHLQKPFFKLQSLARTGEAMVPLDEMNKLGDYLNDPLMALATEESGYPTLKSIIKKLYSTIEQGKLKLKSTRIRKAKDQINMVLNQDSLEQLQKTCKETLSQRNHLLTSETLKTMQNQLTQLQNQLEELQKEYGFVTARGMSQREEQRRLQERTEHLTKELEKTVLELTNKTVQIVWAG